MKTQLFLILTAATLLFSNTAKAENAERNFDLAGTNVRISAINKTVLVTLNQVTDDVTIALENTDGITIVNDKIKATPHFAKKYNLVNLENGTYRFVITKKLVKTVQPFELTDKTIVMNETERREKFLPNVVQRGNKMDVNVLLGNYSNIKVNVYNNEGRKVFEEVNYVVLVLNKRYDLSNLTSGLYVVEVIAGDETQYFNVQL